MKPSAKKQDELIQSEIDKLNTLFEDISADKKKVIERLIERIAFMTITLQVLEDNIKRKGPTYLFKQGTQEMYVENPAQKSYNTMINRYTSAYGRLLDLLPQEPKKEDDGFESFVMDRD